MGKNNKFEKKWKFGIIASFFIYDPLFVKKHNAIN